jgi:hypothetical protein
MKTIRPFAWWNAAECAVRGLHEPRQRFAASDRAVERLLADSAAGIVAAAIASAIRRAWHDSKSGALVRRASMHLTAGDTAAQVRRAGVIAVVAFVTAMAIDVAAPAAVDRLFWVAPAIGIGSGALLVAAPRALGRAIDDKRR